MKVEVLSSGKVLYSGEANSVKVPGEQSPFTILKGHIPIVSTLISGDILIERSGKLTTLAISGGFVQVTKEAILIVVKDERE